MIFSASDVISQLNQTIETLMRAVKMNTEMTHAFLIDLDENLMEMVITKSKAD
jgi:hypothetical protein